MPIDQEASVNEFDEKARAIVGQMSLDEKIDLLAGDGRPFAILLQMGFARNKRPYPAGRNARLGLAGMHFSDGPRGVALGHATCFPSPIGRGAAWDVALETQIGEAIGIEARALGANLVGAVSINLLRHPAWGRAQDTYGEDPYHLGELGAALVTGLQRHAMACVKHFACNSIEDTRTKVDIRIAERTLRELYLPHFQRCLEAGAASVMSAYNKVNGEYCSENRHLLTEILREEWGFDGFVLSDFVFALHDGANGLAAGLDLEMPNPRRYGKKLKQLLQSGAVQQEWIDRAACRLVRQQLRFAGVGQADGYPLELVASPAHRQIAYQSALESIVLLKNQPPSLQLSLPDANRELSRLVSFSRQQPAAPARQRLSYWNGPAGEHSLTEPLLPLNITRLERLAVVGKLAFTPNLGDHGSGRVYPAEVVTPLLGLQAAAKGRFEVVSDESGLPAPAADLARNADVAVVVVGNSHSDEGENMVTHSGDRKSLELNQADMVLILSAAAANPRTVVVMMGGAPYLIEKWREFIPAILMAWYPGMEGGRALADLLLGHVSPSGKLPVGMPKSEEHLPPFDNRAQLVEYGYYHGYRLLEKQHHQPAYPFGFGLSYTSYRYQNLRLEHDRILAADTLRLSVEVSNTGSMAGDEVVQVYVGYPGAGVDRPVKELKAFQRLHLLAGETKTVSFEIPASRLAYYDEDQAAWKLETGLHWVYAGGSSDPHDLLDASFGLIG